MPGAEQRPGYIRPFGQPAFQKFDAGLPGEGSGLSRHPVMSPIAANLVRLLEQARQRRVDRGFSNFFPQWWMYTKIGEIVADLSPHWRRQVQSEGFQRFAQQEGIDMKSIPLRSEISDEGLEERQQFFSDIATAYGIAAYGQFMPRQKNRFREILREDIRELNIGNVTLNEQQRELLTEIANATNTPIVSDQAEYHFYTVLTQPDITEEEMQKDPHYNTW